MAKRTFNGSNKMLILSVLGVAVLISISAFSFLNKPKDIITGVPNEVNKFLQPKDINFLKDQNFTVYTGNTPPNIEGTYILDSLRSTFNSIEQDTGKIGSYRMQIYDQKNYAVSLKFFSLESNDISGGGGAFISGEGNCFTVFVDEKGISNDGCNYNTSSIMSGCMVEKGIQNYEESSIMKHKDDKAVCDETLMPVGNIRIKEEEDKLAVRKE